VPRVVDHDSRRQEIIAAVWSLISQKGFQGVTMRELATEAGYANGALARYFPDKEAVLRAAFTRAFEATNVRARAAIGTRGGLVALRLLCLEIMPLDDVRLREARVVIGFWDHAAGDPQLVEFFDSAMGEWRGQIGRYLRQAEVAAPHEVVIDTVLAWAMGLQINALFSPRRTTPDRQIAMLDALLATIAHGWPTAPPRASGSG
jgi:AcrR family transcriptional regulator